MHPPALSAIDTGGVGLAPDQERFFLPGTKKMALGIVRLPSSRGSNWGASTSATPRVEFEVPKSRPQALVWELVMGQLQCKGWTS
jgi:hypothetical protein